jgi:integrase
MVTVGKDPETGRPICKLLQPVAYFATYNEAYEALLKYNTGSSVHDRQMTVEELYKEWSDWYYPALSKSAIETHITAWNCSKVLHNVRVCELKSKNIRECIECCEAITTKPRIKTLFSLMLDYAVEHEYIDQNYAKNIKLNPLVSKELGTVKNAHIAFTEDELSVMWSKVNEMPYVDWMLIQCYTGMRPREMLGVLVENVDLDGGVIVAGMKTEAGRDRIIPIHEKIKGLVRSKILVAKQLDSPYLFNQHGKIGMSYTTYNKYFTEVVESLELDKRHRPHDPRKTFVTMAKRKGVDEYAIKRIIGHAVGDLTEEKYTDRSVEWLKNEMGKI